MLIYEWCRQARRQRRFLSAFICMKQLNSGQQRPGHFGDSAATRLSHNQNDAEHTLHQGLKAPGHHMRALPNHNYPCPNNMSQRQVEYILYSVTLPPAEFHLSHNRKMTIIAPGTKLKTMYKNHTPLYRKLTKHQFPPVPLRCSTYQNSHKTQLEQPSQRDQCEKRTGQIPSTHIG